LVIGAAVPHPVYLDHNATSPVRPEAMTAMTAALAQAANPSSVHAAGRRVRSIVEDAREAVAALVGADASGLVFTSGGTEANALAMANAGTFASRLILGATEHEAVAANAAASGLPLETWPVDPRGVADMEWLKRRLAALTAAGERPLVALMLANNETGVIQPVAEAASLVHAAHGWLHVDAVQALGKISIDVARLGADTLALSAHKLGGPQGIGALVHGADAPVQPWLRGGGQERGLRAGTENVPGIAGFAAAAQAALRDIAGVQARAIWRDGAAARLAAAGGVVVGAGADRLPNTLCMATPGFDASLQVISLDLEGVMVSAGAACSSGKVRPSGVLTAMGLTDLAGCAIRASGGWTTIEHDWDRFADVWCAVYARHATRARMKEFA
jgi:cysteine desulfurase